MGAYCGRQAEQPGAVSGVIFSQDTGSAPSSSRHDILLQDEGRGLVSTRSSRKLLFSTTVKMAPWVAFGEWCTMPHIRRSL